MRIRNAGVDFVAYKRDGKVVLLAEANSSPGTSDDWAAKLRRNILARGELPASEYFLIATPDRIYGWTEKNSPGSDVPPQFTVDARKAFARYFSTFGGSPDQLGHDGFEMLVHIWLSDLALFSEDQADPALRPLSESGLLASLQKAEVEATAAR